MITVALLEDAANHTEEVSPPRLYAVMGKTLRVDWQESEKARALFVDRISKLNVLRDGHDVAVARAADRPASGLL